MLWYGRAKQGACGDGKAPGACNCSLHVPPSDHLKGIHRDDELQRLARLRSSACLVAQPHFDLTYICLGANRNRQQPTPFRCPGTAAKGGRQLARAAALAWLCHTAAGHAGEEPDQHTVRPVAASGRGGWRAHIPRRDRAPAPASGASAPCSRSPQTPSARAPSRGWQAGAPTEAAHGGAWSEVPNRGRGRALAKLQGHTLYLALSGHHQPGRAGAQLQDTRSTRVRRECAEQVGLVVGG